MDNETKELDPTMEAAVPAWATAFTEGGGLEGYTFMGLEIRKTPKCLIAYRWFYRRYRAWYSVFLVQCIEVKLQVVVYCPGRGVTIRSAEFERCSFGSISPSEINRATIEGQFKELLGVDLPQPLDGK